MKIERLVAKYIFFLKDIPLLPLTLAVGSEFHAIHTHYKL